NSAFAVIVGAHHYRDVFERGGDQERPDDQRKHADCYCRGGAARPFKRGLERVKRTRADVAIDNAQRAQYQRAVAARSRTRLIVGGSSRGNHRSGVYTRGSPPPRDGNVMTFEKREIRWRSAFSGSHHFRSFISDASSIWSTHPIANPGFGEN